MSRHFIHKREWGDETEIEINGDTLTLERMLKDRYDAWVYKGDLKIDKCLLKRLKRGKDLNLEVTNHRYIFYGESTKSESKSSGIIELLPIEAKCIYEILTEKKRQSSAVVLRSLPRGAYIFDKDGTLLDTESTWFEAYSRMLARYGLTHDTMTHQKMMGLSAEDCVAILQKTYPTLPQGNQAIQDLVAELRESFDLVRYGLGVHVMPGVREFLQDCRGRGIPLAIATSATRKVTTKELAFLQWNDMFKVILTSDDVTAHKPAPDIYLKAAKLLELDPKECLVFEDGLNGIKSAQTAGMQVVHVRDPRFCNESPDDVALSITSFEEL